MDNEIPGMQGLCWSDLPLSPDEVYNMQMAGVFDDMATDDVEEF